MVNGNTFRDSNSVFYSFFLCLPFHLGVKSLRTEFAPMGSKFFPSRVDPNLERESKVGILCKHGGKTKKPICLRVYFLNIGLKIREFSGYMP